MSGSSDRAEAGPPAGLAAAWNRGRDYVLLGLSLLGLVLSWVPGVRAAIGFDPAWLAVACSGIPIVAGAARAMVASLDVTADLLVSLAMVGALAIGEYFAAGEVAFIMALGGLLEEITSRRAFGSLAGLLESVPPTAAVLRDGHAVPVPVAEVRPEDTVLVKAGETIPVDGQVLEGHSAVDESAVTGESIPVEKRPRDPVYAGSVNQLGTLTVGVTGAGEDSTLGTVARLVRRAQESKAPVVRLADRWASIVVLLVLTLAPAVWLATGDVSRAITVLVVFCPCALVLATPTAVVASIGRAARSGILIKDGRTCENLGRIRAVLFDKTGTLTRGQVELLHAIPAPGVTRERLLCAAAAVERGSSHVLSKPIVSAAEELGLEAAVASGVQTLPGLGVRGTLPEGDVVVGSMSLLDETGTTVPGCLAQAYGAEEGQGRTAVLVVAGGEVLGVLSLADQVKPDGAAGVAQLKAMGISPVGMLTGDNERVAAGIARAVGIEDYSARLLPAQKLEAIGRIQATGARVAMVGDGINDAPALAAADVGVAMGARSSSVAVETADVTIMSDRVTGVAEALRIGRRTLAVISQNLWAALLINLAAVVLASTGRLTPLTGALWHNAGSVAVVLNSARLIGRPVALGAAAAPPAARPGRSSSPRP